MQVGNKSNHVTILGVLKPNDNGGDVVFQFKDNSKKVVEIKFSLRDFCEYLDVGGNVHIPINKNLQTIFYNSDFFKTHFETPGKNIDKSYVRYKDNNHEDPPRADFFVDGMNSAFKDLITVYDNKHYKGETFAEGTKVVDNKEKKNTEINEREGMNLMTKKYPNWRETLEKWGEEWKRMTPEQRRKWKENEAWMDDYCQKLLEKRKKIPLTEEEKKHIAWMDSVEDGSYRTEKDKKRIQELADSIL